MAWVTDAKGEQPNNLGLLATLREQPTNLGLPATLREQPTLHRIALGEQHF